MHSYLIPHTLGVTHSLLEYVSSFLESIRHSGTAILVDRKYNLFWCTTDPCNTVYMWLVNVMESHTCHTVAWAKSEICLFLYRTTSGFLRGGDVFVAQTKLGHGWLTGVCHSCQPRLVAVPAHQQPIMIKGLGIARLLVAHCSTQRARVYPYSQPFSTTFFAQSSLVVPLAFLYTFTSMVIAFHK